ncbi:MAG TPA: lactoylglutathione lyase [Stellaceae bacterium]|nr:lactoylglutathione lyase [Stellaceae bacterium]
MDTATESQAKAAVDTSGFRLLHTMLRVLDMDRSVDFYTRLLGMRLIRRRDVPDGRYTIAFVGYGDEEKDTVLELTYNWDQKEPYALGSAFGHLAVATPDLYKTCDVLAKEGVKIPRPPGPLKFGTTHIAFIEDPDGYRIELIQRK